MTKHMAHFIAEAKEAVGEALPHQAVDALNGGEGLVLDVREPNELQTDGYVGGALHIPRGLLEAHADPVSPVANERLTAFRGDDRTVYVLCASGARAAMAAHRLSEMGYRAQPIAGGLKGWQEAGLPINSGTETTS